MGYEQPTEVIHGLKVNRNDQEKFSAATRSGYFDSGKCRAFSAAHIALPLAFSIADFALNLLCNRLTYYRRVHFFGVLLQHPPGAKARRDGANGFLHHSQPAHRPTTLTIGVLFRGPKSFLARGTPKVTLRFWREEDGGDRLAG